ncbi:MAG: o-succinylbenzoate synthase [Bacteroidales bacterium]|jgi:o-succinylbenzoate synthase|nr:o-succinylbenzoate synthase [Bacteroidales bacterium]HOI32897.1 o-succinylbenzoate synthase [Bacteroidales bacterium]
MLKARYIYHPLHFKRPAGTSRGVLQHKASWFLEVWDADNPAVRGTGEVSLIPGLTLDNENEIPDELRDLCENPDGYLSWITEKGDRFPAMRFAIETALSDLQNGGKKIFAHNAFTEGKTGIPINGLIWMGNPDFMQSQIREKLETGFNCIKIKVGAIDFEQEIELIKQLRNKYSAKIIEIRLDANGAFSKEDALQKLNKLAVFDIHSIEQPIKAGQMEVMADLCQKTPIPIALDEELIGIKSTQINNLLDTIKPHYVILKPSLLGGFSISEAWIATAIKRQIGWWATSALESNIGLNAIAQWVFEKKSDMPQGLGTGQLYTNNITSPLEIRDARLYYNPEKYWQNSFGK